MTLTGVELIRVSLSQTGIGLPANRHIMKSQFQQMSLAVGLEDRENWFVLGERIKAGNVKASFGEHIQHVCEYIYVHAYNLRTQMPTCTYCKEGSDS